MDSGGQPDAGTCPGCGAALPAAACPVCTELGHLVYLRDWLDDPSVSRCLMREQAKVLRDSLTARRARLLPRATPPAPAPAPPLVPPRAAAAMLAEPEIPVAPPPSRPVPTITAPPRPTPPPPPAPPKPVIRRVRAPRDEPTEWHRFKQATGFSWLYVVGVLFIAAGLFWAVAAAGEGPLGRLLLACIVTGLTGTALWAGRRLIDQMGLAVGGQAMLAGGSMLVSASLLSWVNLGAAELSVSARLVAWLATTVCAAMLARSRGLPSQLTVANTFAAVALWDGALNLAGPEQASGWLGLLFCPLAAGNLLLARHTAADGLAVAARRSTYVFLALASLGLALAGGDALSVGWLARLVGAVLLGGLFLALGHETQRGAPIGLAALTWWLASLILGPSGLDGLGAWLAVTALLWGHTRAEDDEELGRWYLGSAVTLTCLALAPLLTALLGAAPTWPRAAGAWALAATYLALAATERDTRALGGSLAVGTLAVLVTGRLAPLATDASLALWLLVEAVALTVAAGRVRHVEWPTGRPARLIGWWAVALAPLVMGLSPLSAVLTPLVLGVFALVAVVLSILLDERLVLYVAIVAGFEALALAAANAELSTLLPAQLGAVALTACAWLGSRHWQPFEVSGAAIMMAMPLVALADPQRIETPAVLAVATLYWLAPLVPAWAQKSRLPALLTCGLRPVAVALFGAAACATAGRVGQEPNWLAAALWAVVLATAPRRLAADSPWSAPWRGSALLLGCVLSGLAGWSVESQPLPVLVAAQIAVQVAARGDNEWLLLGWLCWLLAVAARVQQPGWPYAGDPLGWALADALVGAGYLLSCRRRGLGWGLGLVCLLLVPTCAATPWLTPEWLAPLGATVGLAVVLSARLVDPERAIAARWVGALSAAGWLVVGSQAAALTTVAGCLTLVIAQLAFVSAAHGSVEALGVGWLAWLAVAVYRGEVPGWPYDTGCGPLWAVTDALIGAAYLLVAAGRQPVVALGTVCFLLAPNYLVSGLLAAEWQPLLGVLTGLVVVLLTRWRCDRDDQTAQWVGVAAAALWLVVSGQTTPLTAVASCLVLVAAQATFIVATRDRLEGLAVAWLAWLAVAVLRGDVPGWPYDTGCGPLWAVTDALIGAAYLLVAAGRQPVVALGTVCFLLAPNYLVSGLLAAEWQPALGALTGLAVVLLARRFVAGDDRPAEWVGVAASAVWLAVSSFSGPPDRLAPCLVLVIAQAAFVVSTRHSVQGLALAWAAWLAAVLTRCAVPDWPFGTGSGPLWAATDLVVGGGYLLVAAGRRPVVLLGSLCCLLVPNYLASPWLPPEWQPALGTVTALCLTARPRRMAAADSIAVAVIATLWMLIASANGSLGQPWNWVTLVVGQVALLRAASLESGLHALGWLVWAWCVARRGFDPGWPSGLAGGQWLALVDIGLCAAYVRAARQLEPEPARDLTAAALLLTSLVPAYLAGPAMPPARQPLLAGVWVAAITALAWWWTRRGHEPGARAAVGLAAAGAVVTTLASIAWSPPMDTLALLCLDALLVAPWAPTVSLWLGHGAALWAIGAVWPTGDEPTAGLRISLLVLLDVVLAAALRAYRQWRDACLAPASLLAPLAVLLMMLPPSRPSVLGLLVLAVAAVTAAWLVERRALNDAGFASAWLAGIMVLYDAATHGRGDLLPYRSLDLYLAPLAIYVLAVSERRSESPAGLRLMAVAMLLGSLLVSALAGAGWLHSAALFVAVAGSVAYGVLRDDLAIRYTGLAAFAAWFLVFLWRQQENSRWLLIPLLVLLGLGAVWLAVTQERRQRE